MKRRLLPALAILISLAIFGGASAQQPAPPPTPQPYRISVEFVAECEVKGDPNFLGFDPSSDFVSVTVYQSDGTQTVCSFDTVNLSALPMSGGTPQPTTVPTTGPTAAPTATIAPTPTDVPTALPSATSVPTAAPTATSVPADVCATSLQGLVDAAPAGGVVDVPACTYLETVTLNRPVTLDGHGAAVIDGGGIRDRWVWIAASDVTVRGFTMRNAATPSQVGAVATLAGSQRVVIEGNDLGPTSDGSLIAIGGTTDSRVVNNTLHGGGQMGLSTFQNTRLTISGNRVSGNNTAGVDPYWAAGGIKAVQDAGLVIEGNDIGHNEGPGIWVDILATDVVISGNRVHDQTWNPILFEVSSRGEIFGNTVTASPTGAGNWGCIVSSSAAAVTIRDNVCTDTLPIRAQLDDRPDKPPGAGTGNVLRDNRLERPNPNQATSWWQWSATGPLVPGQNGNVDQGNVVVGGTAKLWGVNYAGGEFGEPGTVGVENTNYIYPAEASRATYFAGKGLRLVRLPVTWERLQHEAMGPLTPADVAGVRRALDAAQAGGQLVILDLHNFARYYGAPMDLGNAAAFTDVWRKLATEFKGHPALYGYELMNEPHDIAGGSATWATLAQAGTDGIRQADQTAYVLVPGYSWQSARFWRDNNESLAINDPAGKLLYAAHIYLDSDYSGAYNRSYDADGGYPAIGSDRVQPFLDWLTAKGGRGILTEYGVPGDDARWLVALDGLLKALEGHPSVVGGTYWAAGPWWGDYRLSVEPEGGADKPQMTVLTR